MFDNIKRAGLFRSQFEFVGGKLCIFFQVLIRPGSEKVSRINPCQNFRQEIAYNTTDLYCSTMR